MEETVLKKGIFALIIACVLALTLTGCGNSNSKSDESAQTATEQPKEVTYESILEDYTQKLKEQTPVLVDEYKSEAKEKAGDVQALAELSNAKIAKLATTCDEGIAEMAKIMQKNGDEYSTYEEWSLKLTDVYMEQSELITDAYTDSAM